MRPGDLVLITQRRTGITELMVCIDPYNVPGRIHNGPCTYSLFLNMAGKLERVLNELHIYEITQEFPSR
jgi:hypothetical protein